MKINRDGIKARKNEIHTHKIDQAGEQGVFEEFSTHLAVAYSNCVSSDVDFLGLL
jgi:hypothetical protein